MIVHWGTTISTQFTVANVVKRGEIISFILLNMYMDDLSISLSNSGIGGYLGDAFFNHLCYADEICLISLSSSGMQLLLNICQNYATNHQLLYNGATSFSLCFKNNAINITIFLIKPSFYLAHLKIPIVENCNYLGITMSTKNSDLDLKKQMRKIYVNANLLLRKFSCCSVSVKCCLCKTYCSTSTLYCAPIWLDCTKTALKKLKVAYNNSLRRFMRLPWRNSASEMFVNLNIRSFDEMLRIFTLGFMSELLFLMMRLYLIFTTHPVVSLYSNIWSWSWLTYDRYSFIYMNLIFTFIVLIICSSVILIQFTLTFYW